jgi:hypothetical protein
LVPLGVRGNKHLGCRSAPQILPQYKKSPKKI